MTKIGIIGAGKIGKAFARHAAKAGYDTLISNSRGPESLRPVVEEIGQGIKAGTTQEAAAADIVFLAVPWNKLEEAVAHVPSWENRVVIDATNAVLPGFVPADLDGQASSEVVASLLPGSKVVKAFNTLLAAVLAANPQEEGGNRVIFYSGNDAEAKRTVLDLINRIGFAGVDLGTLNEGGRLQQFPGGPLPALNLVKLK
ncbi:NADPH-dependent F420 reductase [Rufibacter hautae]|uniref:NADPH-dependent F420 reductase n=1 Tax=Rufibacter hautae TaxID=2595005 RepID=A0A5B6TKD7_9BACT|nr:NADPH-dependent F420 reductase [Rufibacter hautae]KAA3439835.1 NADPH-dependent F420 reductase [Rufibacter hautae]